jgi:hypothetical protein
LVLSVDRQLEFAFLKVFLNVLQEQLSIVTVIQVLEQLVHIGLHLGQMTLGIVTVLWSDLGITAGQ